MFHAISPPSTPSALRTDTGTLPGDHPYVSAATGATTDTTDTSAGDDSRALVVLPGVGDSMFPGTYPPFSGWAIAPYFRRYLRTHAAYVLSRPRGLPPEYDAADAVETHARALESIGESHAGIDVLGISMGGLIGQELARRRPDLVDRLVLASGACRLGEGALATVDDLERYAHSRDWASIRSLLATTMFTDGRAVAYPLFLQTIGRGFQPRPADPADVWRSIRFVRKFDSCDRLGGIEAPTLLVGGDADPIFPPERTRETVAGIPDAELELVRGTKHGAFHERKHTFDRRVRSFLDEK